jgi:hypothetical protein
MMNWSQKVHHHLSSPDRLPLLLSICNVVRLFIRVCVVSLFIMYTNFIGINLCILDYRLETEATRRERNV